MKPRSAAAVLIASVSILWCSQAMAGTESSKSEPSEPAGDRGASSPGAGESTSSGGGVTDHHSPPDYGPYEADISRRIKRVWFPPKNADLKLRVKVGFKIGKDGSLADSRLEIVSGSEKFDSAAVKAVENASPFRVLPAGAPLQVDVSCSFSGADVFAYVKREASKDAAVDINLIPAKDYIRKTVQGVDLSSYFETARAKVIQHWNPTETAGKPVVIGFHVAKAGHLQDIEILEQSGTPVFDNSAKLALEAARTFGKLPSPIKEEQWSWAVFDGKEVLIGVPQDIDYGPYMAAMQKKIRSAWMPPKSDRSKRVTVQFKVFRNGEMSHLKVIGPSGSASADSAAMEAAQGANPLPQLPRGSPPDVDIQFTFDYNVDSDHKASNEAPEDDSE